MNDEEKRKEEKEEKEEKGEEDRAHDGDGDGDDDDDDEESVTVNKEEASVWKARRQRRRDRQRVVRQAEAAHHVKGDTQHWASTADRHRREAIRAQLRRAMLAPWNDGGEGGLRVVIDCGRGRTIRSNRISSNHSFIHSFIHTHTHTTAHVC